MMIPKQKPVKPAPPIAPSCPAVKPNSVPQLSMIPPRIANPIPAARIDMNPAAKRRLLLPIIDVLPIVFLLTAGTPRPCSASPALLHERQPLAGQSLLVPKHLSPDLGG